MKLNLSRLLRMTSRGLEENKELLVTWVATTSLGATLIFAITGQRKADAEIEERNKQLAVNDEEPLTPREEVEVSVRHHITTAISAGLTIFFIWKGYSYNMDKKAQIIELTGSYALLSKSYDELQKAVDESGHREEIKEKVLDNVYQEHKEEAKAENEHPHNGLTWFIEEVTGQGWWDTREGVKEMINKANYEMLNSNGYAVLSLNELLTSFGLRKLGGADESLGDRIGWDANYTGLIDVKFYRPEASDDDPNKNVWVVGYFNPPKENFGRELM